MVVREESAYIISSEEQLREIIAPPREMVAKKEMHALDGHFRALIERSPFVLIASSDAAGNCDVSPKGDPAGFVQVLDDRTLVIPDRPGNGRADTLRNIIENPHVGLLFIVPGMSETVRVTGRARINVDPALLARLAVKGKLPKLAIEVSVESAFVHCAKCMIRSDLWEPSKWPDRSELPSMAQMMSDQIPGNYSVDDVQTLLDESYRERLY